MTIVGLVAVLFLGVGDLEPLLPTAHAGSAPTGLLALGGTLRLATAADRAAAAQPSAPGATVGWSTGYYVGWQQAAYPPQTLLWTAFTHVNHFSVMTSPSRNGGVVLAHSLTPAFMQAAVTAAHQHNVKIHIAVGGAEDNNFDAACNSANRATFINNLVGIMQTYGYDGIDLDIEQDFGAPNHTDYIACVQQLRARLNTITPRPGLTMSVDPDWQADMAAPVAQYVDQINLMSYWTDVNGIGAKLNNYTSLGIPKSKLGVGLGLGDDGGIDTTAAACTAKTQYVVNNGYGGVMEWKITDDPELHGGQTPCLSAVAQYVSQVPPTVTPICSPRPAVRVTTASGGTGRLQTQITATTTTGAPNNRLVEIRFGAATNALVDVRTVVGSTGNTTVALTDRPQSVSFTVRRRTAGRAMTVSMVVIDDCGAWPTFVGSGPNVP